MSLAKLPAEILQLIADRLPQMDKPSLLLTSRRLHDVCQRSLYTDVILPNNVKKGSHRALLNTVVLNPELACCIRSLTTQYWGDKHDPIRKNRDILEPDSELVKKLVNETSGLTKKEKRQWIKELKLNMNDHWLALLIPRLTRLRKVNLGSSTGSLYHVLRMFRKAANLNGVPCLPHFEEAYFPCHVPNFKSLFMHPFFRFPSMGRVDGWRAVGHFEKQIFDPEPEFPYEDLKGENLLQCSKTPEDYPTGPNVSRAGDLQAWLLACKEMKSFRIVNTGPDNSNKCVFKPHDIENRLIHHNFDMLDTIWIELGEYEMHSYSDIWWIGSFAGFPALKCIFAHLESLFVVHGDLDSEEMSDVLPLSLQTLFLRIRERDDSIWYRESDPEDPETGDVSRLLEELIEIIASRKLLWFRTLHIDLYRGLKNPENIARIECLQKTCGVVGVSWSVYTTRKG